MGSLRGRVTAVTATACSLPHLAYAEVCDKIRPEWAPGTRVSSIGEALYAFSTLPALILVLLTFAALIVRVRALSFVLVLIWIGAALLLHFGSGEIQISAISEGCMGSLFATQTLIAAICVLLSATTIRAAARTSS